GNAGLANADEKRHPLPDDDFQANAQAGYGKFCLQSVILAEHFPDGSLNAAMNIRQWKKASPH
ncbi:hypothetical protein, partial [Delftia acidovorans]|uniref:hypothetical protein n=1 Tax=Delftia acidovorans TaxID=80866 RepID=UPI0035A011A8